MNAMNVCVCDSGRVLAMPSRMQSIMDAIDAQNAAPPEPAPAIATDSAAPQRDADGIPVLQVPECAKEFLQPRAASLREAELIASFYEGVPYAKGLEKHEAYLQRKAERKIGRGGYPHG